MLHKLVLGMAVVLVLHLAAIAGLAQASVAERVEAFQAQVVDHEFAAAVRTFRELYYETTFDLTEAYDLLSERIEAGDSEALLTRGYLYFLSGDDVEQALADAEAAYAAMPESVSAQVIYGELLLPDNPSVAEPLLQDALQRAAGDPDVLYEVGAAYLTVDSELAVEYLAEALALDDSVPEYYDAQATALRNLGYSDVALILLDSAIELDPDNAIILRQRAQLLAYDLEDYARAINDIERAHELQPNSVLTAYELMVIAFAATEYNLFEYAAEYWIDLYYVDFVSGDEVAVGDEAFYALEDGLFYTLPIELDQNQEIDIYVTAISGNVDPLIFLRQPNNGPIWTYYDDVSRDNYNVALENFVVPVSGRWQLIIAHSLGGGDGEVRLDIERSSFLPGS